MDAEPAHSEFLYPDPGLGPYRVRLWFKVVRGRPAVVGVEAWGVEPQVREWLDRSRRSASRMVGGELVGSGDLTDSEPVEFSLPETPVTAAAIRLPLGAMVRAWVQAHRAVGRAAIRVGADRKAVRAYLASLAGTEERRKRGRPPLPPELLRMVADIYERAGSDPDYFSTPNKLVQVELERVLRKPVSAGTVRSWVHQARNRGLLEKVRPREEEP